MMPPTDPPINEGALYDHPEGRVRVVHVDGHTGAVSIQHTEETVVIDGQPMPRAWRERLEAFAERVEPADLVIGASSESLAATEEAIR